MANMLTVTTMAMGPAVASVRAFHLAERNLFVAIAKLVWAFNISAGKDSEGKEIEPDVSHETGYCAGFLVCAEDFPATITPRSEGRRQTILREFERARTQVFSRFETPKE